MLTAILINVIIIEKVQTKGAIMAIKQSDKEHFREIYERHVDDIYRLCFSYMKNPHDSEDAVSVVFCKLIKKSPVFETQEQEKAWLVVTACNECKSMLRALRRHPRVEISELPEQKGFEDTEHNDIIDAIISLPEKYSSVLYLHFYLGYSLKEIAKMTKQNESTVRSQLFYGKRKLASLIGGNDDEGVQ